MGWLVGPECLSDGVVDIGGIAAIGTDELDDTLPLETQCITLVPADDALSGWIDKVDDSLARNGQHAVVDSVDDDVRFAFDGGEFVLEVDECALALRRPQVEDAHGDGGEGAQAGDKVADGLADGKPVIGGGKARPGVQEKDDNTGKQDCSTQPLEPNLRNVPLSR